MQPEELILNRHAVTGIIAAAESGDDVGLAGKPIGDTPFSLISPLSADDKI
jgi:hypothetical protein